jgi:hypothetical protein
VRSGVRRGRRCATCKAADSTGLSLAARSGRRRRCAGGGDGGAAVRSQGERVSRARAATALRERARSRNGRRRRPAWLGAGGDTALGGAANGVVERAQGAGREMTL